MNELILMISSHVGLYNLQFTILNDAYSNKLMVAIVHSSRVANGSHQRVKLNILNTKKSE